MLSLQDIPPFQVENYSIEMSPLGNIKIYRGICQHQAHIYRDLHHILF